MDDIVNAMQAAQQPSADPFQSDVGGGDDDGGSDVQVLQQQQPQQQQAAGDAPEAALASRFRRSGSERLRDGAKAILRRVESLKTRRRKQRNRDGVVIGSPQVGNNFFCFLSAFRSVF